MVSGGSHPYLMFKTVHLGQGKAIFLWCDAYGVCTCNPTKPGALLSGGYPGWPFFGCHAGVCCLPSAGACDYLKADVQRIRSLPGFPEPGSLTKCLTETTVYSMCACVFLRWSLMLAGSLHTNCFFPRSENTTPHPFSFDLC